MTQDASAPTGLTRRRRRLSDEETEQRMLQAALAMVNQAGLTVSLDHISFEDVIRDAGVSRSAVYRRWPYKDLFFSDLLRELARGSSPAIVTGNPDGDRCGQAHHSRPPGLAQDARATAAPWPPRCCAKGP